MPTVGGLSRVADSKFVAKENSMTCSVNLKRERTLMTSTNRLKTYTALAAAPCAALGGIAAETHAAPGQVPATAQLNNSTFVSVDAFTAADLQFQAFAFYSSASSNSGGLQIYNPDRGKAGDMKFWGVETGSQTISFNATGFDKSNNGFGGWKNAGTQRTSMVGTGPSGSGYLGFAVQNTNTGTYVAGWVNFTYDRSLGNGANGNFFTINSWLFNTGDVTTSITMPGTAASGAVPGVGGLAGLAMGAAGLRRKRQRVA